MVVLVRHDDAVHTVNGRGGRSLELALAFAAGAEMVEETAFEVVYLKIREKKKMKIRDK